MHLRDIAIWVLRILGAILIYSAAFLHEDEEGRIQNLIEEWWVKVDESRKLAISKSASFIKVAAGIADRGLNRVFGESLVSLRTVCVSICYSFASMRLIGGLAYPPDIPFYWLLRVSVITIGFAGLGTIPALIKGRRALVAWEFVVAATIVWSLAEFWNYFKGLTYAEGQSSTRMMMLLAAAISASFVVDILCILLTRWLLRRSADSIKSATILGLFLLNGAIVVFLSLITFLPISETFVRHVFTVANRYGESFVASTLMWMSPMNGFDILVCSYAAVVMLIMVLHLLAWPLIERPLYACARYGIIKQKTLLWALGGTLLIGPPHLVSVGHWLLEKVFGASG